ncbi:MAG: hypothetical protein MK479_01030 [Planctomycetes bacterium]|nr:hypothetical protein [Planctomycetota bacterium]
MQANAQDDPPLGEDLVRCRHCDDKGKMACRSCEGKGKLYKTCPQCNGGGRRPCRQCNKPNAEEPNEAGPGKISCGYCGGDGKFGVRDKRCPKCGGGGSYPCPSCRGKGDHKCKTELPAGICPSCRFTGKETCNTCYGKRWIRREPVPSRTKPGEKNSKSPGEGNEDEIDPGTLVEDIQKRFDSLAAIRARETEIDTGELRRSCEKGMISSKGFLERLERFKDNPGSPEASRALYNEILQAQKDLRALKGDLFELDTLLHEFDKAYHRCEARLESRPKSPFNTTKKKKELEVWSENIVFSLKAAEKLANDLGKGEVFLAGKTSGKIEEDLNLFDSRIQSEEAAAAAVKPPKDEPEIKTGTPKTSPDTEAGTAPAEKEAPASIYGLDGQAKEESGKKAAAKAASKSSDGVLLGILCGLGGALAGAGILLLYLRKKHYF